MFLKFHKQFSLSMLLRIISIPLCVIFGVHTAMAAAPAIDKNMKLAMLTLTNDNLVAQRAASVKQKKPIVKAKPKLNFPNNCLTWNAKQVHAKADQYKIHINKYAKQYKVDVNLVKSVITAESCFKRKALSSAGAQGLMQLIPDTAKRFGVTDSYDPKQNIRAGVKYLRFLLDRFKGDLKKVVAAYNAGEGAVDRYKGIPPYKETKQYVKNVLKVYGLLNPNLNKKRVKAVYQPPKLGQKPGRHGWKYNRKLAPHLYKKM